MGYFLDNTVEIEVDGVIHRVFTYEADVVKAKLMKQGKKVKAGEPNSKKFDPNI